MRMISSCTEVERAHVVRGQFSIENTPLVDRTRVWTRLIHQPGRTLSTPIPTVAQRQVVRLCLTAQE